jgi:AAA ATPase domain
MKITGLRISNFKAITDVELPNLGDMIVVAGPNGCGKSCIYDAIRLLKSAYGGYQPNEWQSWFGEFQIAVNQSFDQWIGLLQQKSAPLKMTAVVVLSANEIAYLRENGRKVLMDQIWREEVPEAAGWRSMSALPLAANLRTHEPRVTTRLENEIGPFLSALELPSQIAELTFTPNVGAAVKPSRVLDIMAARP